MNQPEITLPIWLLQDESISPAMLRVYAKMKAKIPLQEPELKVRSQLVSKGLVRDNSSQSADLRAVSVKLDSEYSDNVSNSDGSSKNIVATLSKNKHLSDSSHARGVAAASTSQTETTGCSAAAVIKTLPSEVLPNILFILARPQDAPINNIKQAPGREEASNERQFNQLEGIKKKIRRFSVKDKRSFDKRWAEFVMLCRALHERSCLVVIRAYLMEKLEGRALTTGIEIVLDYEDWRTRQRGYALQLYQQYPGWQTQDWVEAIDWFLADDFWSNVIIDVKSLRKNINRWVIWKQRKEPQKKKFSAIKVIGRKR